MKNILVIGGSGYLGRNVVKHLIDKDYCVIATYRNNPAGLANDAFIDNRFEAVKFDSIDLHSFQTLLSRVDAVIFLAGDGSPGIVKSIKGSFSSMVEPFLSLAEVNALSFKRPLVFASSGGAVYGDVKVLPVDEATPTRPKSIYGFNKLICEQGLRLLNRKNSFPYCCLRIGNPYGGLVTDDVSHGFVNVMHRNRSTDTSVTIWGDGSTVRDYIHIQDVAVSIELALSHLHNGRKISPEINIGSEKGVSLLDIVHEFKRYKEINVDFKKHSVRPDDVNKIFLDCSKAHTELQWIASISLFDWIASEYQFVKS